jgi:signal recognition particle subunit SRP68
LARLQCIHPSPSYASAVQLLERSSRLISSSRSSLFELGIPLEEEIVVLKAEQVDLLAKQIDALNLSAKRALFAERIPKPVFFDTAFNYIDMPMDELLVLAGKRSATAAAPVAPLQKVAEVAAQAVPAAEEAVKSAVNAVKSRATRETTPAVEEQSEGGKPKKWLGGWFGRG